MMKSIHCRIAALALLITGAAGCSEGARDGAATVGGPAPEYAAVTLTGDTLALADLRGEAVLLNVWATWCPPCREEMPGLQALHEEYADEGLRVVGVSIDARNATAEVERFLEQNDISFTILLDPEDRITRRFRLAGVPETFLLDREGRIRQRWIGKIDPQSEAVVGPVRETLGIHTEETV